MRKLVLSVATVSLLAGSLALAASKGLGPKPKPRCSFKCPPCQVAVDLTPQNKNDCHFVCEAIPGCVEG